MVHKVLEEDLEMTNPRACLLVLVIAVVCAPAWAADDLVAEAPVLEITLQDGSRYMVAAKPDSEMSAVVPLTDGRKLLVTVQLGPDGELETEATFVQRQNFPFEAPPEILRMSGRSLGNLRLSLDDPEGHTFDLWQFGAGLVSVRAARRPIDGIDGCCKCDTTYCCPAPGKCIGCGTCGSCCAGS